MYFNRLFSYYLVFEMTLNDRLAQNRYLSCKAAEAAKNGVSDHTRFLRRKV